MNEFGPVFSQADSPPYLAKNDDKQKFLERFICI